MKWSRSIPISISLLIYIIGLFYYGWLFFYWGKANLGTTLFLYLTVGIVFWRFLNWLSIAQVPNLKLALFSLLIALFIGELSMKFLFKIGLSYGENNGGTYYTNRYLKPGKRKKVEEKERLLTLRTQAPNTQHQLISKDFSYLHKYNSMGLRDQEFSTLQLDSNTFKILCLGDSFTEGVGAHQDSTWVKLLEDALRPVCKDLITFNGGSMGSDPVYEYMKFKDLLLPLAPDLVILTINTTDLGDLYYRGGFDRYEGPFQGVEPPWWEFLYASSYLFRNFTHGVLGYSGNLLSAAEEASAFQKSEEIIFEVVRDFEQLCRINHAQFLLIFLPRLHEVQQNNFLLTAFEKSVKAEGDISAINLLEVYQKKGLINAANAHEFYWPIDLHHNPKGYQTWAEVVKTYLLENNLVCK